MTKAAHFGPFGVPGQRLGTGLAVLALLGQLALGAIVPREAQPTVAALFPWINSICHDDGTDNSTPARHSHPLPGWMVCPFCLALSQPLAHPLVAADAPRPAAAWIAWRPLPPPARAPPSRQPHSAQPRGPPVLI